MNRFSLICGIAIGLLLSDVAVAETTTEQSKAQEIPLDQIWAYHMPGTRDVREVDPLRKETNGVKHFPTVDGISRFLSRERRERDKAGPVFVVEGVDKTALLKVLSSLTKPARVFPPDTDLSLVFYSYLSGRYVHIESVERLNQVITVKYQRIAHPTDESTTHFALIPLGKLPEGMYHIDIKQLPPTDKHDRPVSSTPDIERIVCQDSSFKVEIEE